MPDDGGPIGDVLVIFGITGDLARVMTFRSLYRLEGRGLLDCPIVGAGFDDWTLGKPIGHARGPAPARGASDAWRREKLIAPARDSIVAAGETELDEDVFRRLAGRLSYHHGDFKD